ncbi:MAG: ribbon-helix-helix domain-containing protein [Methanocorpusculum sp.]|nr:ribbon-helix-helix domain-containing protein [Methanocorpusculum sp.]
MARIPGKPIRTRITYYAPPDVVQIIDNLIDQEMFNNKSDVISAAVKEYAHVLKMRKVQELKEQSDLLEERLAAMEEKYDVMISVVSSLQPKGSDNT